MSRIIRTLTIGFFGLVFFYGSAAISDSTTVLPKGRSAVTAGYITADVEREFDDSKEEQDLGYYLDETDVTEIGEGVVLQGLLDAGFPPGVLAPQDILRYAVTSLDAEANVRASILAYNYGITDRLMLGVELPYYLEAETKFDFNVDVMPSDTAAFIIIPPGVTLADYINSLDAKEVTQTYLQEELGFDRVDDWSGKPGIGDLKLSLKYRFLDKDMVKAAAGGWQKFPTGKIDDERNLTDIGYGSGSYDTAVFGMVDLIPVKPVTLNLTGRYVVAWPYERTVYILDEDNPQFYDAEFATKRVKGMYDIGDWYELEPELKLNLFNFVTLSGGYLYMKSDKYTIDGDEVPKSVREMGKYFYGVEISTVNAYRENKFAAPMILHLHGESVDQGRNVEKVERYMLILNVIF